MSLARTILAEIDAPPNDEPTQGSVEWWIEFLDNHELPNKAGRDAARQVIKDAGLSIDTNLLAQVIKKRKQRDVPIDLTGGTGEGNAANGDPVGGDDPDGEEGSSEVA